MMFDSDEQARAHIAAKFSGGRHEIGEPAYQNGDIVAYSPAQAKQIFENLMEARVYGEEIPFIAASHSDCHTRTELMIKHMMHHQKIDPRTIGFTIVQLKDQKTASKTTGTDYYNSILRSVNKTSVRNQHKSDAYNFHVAPTIHVHNDNGFTDMILDPAITTQPSTLPMWLHQMHRSLHENPLIHHSTIETSEHTFVSGNPIEMMKQETLQFQTAFYMLSEIHPPSRINNLQTESLQIAQAQGSLELGIEAQQELREIANLDLPNCGPLALKAVIAARGQRQQQ